MLKNSTRLATTFPPSIFLQSIHHLPPQSLPANATTIRSSAIGPLKLSSFLYLKTRKDDDFGCRARRRVRFEDEDEEEDGEDEHEYNPDIAMLELYSQSSKQEALIVKATVDDNSEEEILIFKGFSSSLTYGTSPDPSKSILPARAVVKSIDRVKGPFNPSNIEYIETGLSLDTFKARLRPI